ncbi:hypothetical protein Q5752_000244 [Cryptotrichosporon argae]
MPPKRSDLVHVTFHFYKSAVLLSVPSTTSVSSLKSQLLPALQPLAATLPAPPASVDDIALYEDRPVVDGEQGGAGATVPLDADADTIGKLGWGRWKRVYVSFAKDGAFGPPEYTIPDVDDDEPIEDA